MCSGVVAISLFVTALLQFIAADIYGRFGTSMAEFCLNGALILQDVWFIIPAVDDA